ncbi:MAG: hypothetical protein GY904_24665 [Planctomycetaceae bacterium]|nr:hypothetical protein [Planctomycetaceae bacterium]
MSKPEAIRLFIELTGESIFWWEPVGDKPGLYLVALADGTQRWVAQNGGEISHWRNLNPC